MNKGGILDDEYAKIALITALVYTKLEKSKRGKLTRYTYKPRNFWALASKLDIVFNRCS